TVAVVRHAWPAAGPGATALGRGSERRLSFRRRARDSVCFLARSARLRCTLWVTTPCTPRPTPHPAMGKNGQKRSWMSVTAQMPTNMVLTIPYTAAWMRREVFIHMLVESCGTASRPDRLARHRLWLAGT